MSKTLDLRLSTLDYYVLHFKKIFRHPPLLHRDCMPNAGVVAYYCGVIINR